MNKQIIPEKIGSGIIRSGVSEINNVPELRPVQTCIDFT